MDVPTISRVSGISATSRIMKGTDRNALTTAPSVRFTQRFSAIPPRSVATSARPSGSPATNEMRPDATVISTVSHSERKSRSINTGDIAKHLDAGAAARQEISHASHVARASGNAQEQGRHRLPLDMVHAAMDETE